jgi:hypothetical protein
VDATAWVEVTMTASAKKSKIRLYFLIYDLTVVSIMGNY